MHLIQASLRTSSILLLGAVFGSGLLRADAVAITNFDFETGGFGVDNFSNSPGVVPTGWTAISPIAGNFYGYFNPSNSAYVGTTGAGVAAGMSGPNVFYFGSATNNQGIQQTLAATFMADTNYALVVAVGSRLGANAVTASLRVNLLAGSTVIATDTFRNASFNGTFADYSLNYSYTSGQSGLVGQALTIQLIEDNSVSTGEVDIDNVRLTATAIPEPSAFAVLLALASGAWVVGRRRRAA